MTFLLESVKMSWQAISITKQKTTHYLIIEKWKSYIDQSLSSLQYPKNQVQLRTIGTCSKEY